MPSYDVYSGDSSVLAAKINSTQTTSITIAAMNINGTLTGWANTAGVIEVSEQSDSTLKREWIYYTGTSVDATTKVATLSGVVRGITSTSSDVTSGGTGVAFSKGAVVRFVTFHDLLNKKANLDRAGSFSANQTFTTNTKIIFGGSGAYIYSTDGGTNLTFKDGSTSAQTLSALAAAAGTDHKLLNTSNDTTAGYLTTKLLAGSGITLTTGSPGGDETSTIDAVNTVATGHTGLSSVTSGNLLLGAGTSNMTELAPSTSGQVPISNGSTFVMGSPVLKYSNTADSTSINSGGGYTLQDFDTYYTIPAGGLAAGAVYEMEATGVASVSTDLGYKFGVKVGSTVLTFTGIAMTSAGGTHVWKLTARIVCRTAGATGTIQCNGEVSVKKSDGITSVQSEILVPDSTSTVDTTGTLDFKPQFAWQTDTYTRVARVKSITVKRLS